MKIAVLGFGNVGQRLAGLFLSAGHKVLAGVRDGQEVAAPVVGLPFAEAVKQAEVVVLTLPYAALAEVLPPLKNALRGKIVVDCSNPVQADWSPLPLGEQHSAGEEVARLLPHSHVVKAFNTIFADVMTPERQERSGGRISAFVASDDAAARQTVLTLASDLGFAPVDAGTLLAARYLEALAHLNIHLALNQGGGTNAAFLFHRAGGVAG